MEKHFAALKLLDSDADWKVTEAFNYSKTPLSQCICVKQVYESESQSNLVRQYSCEQIFSTCTNAREVKTSEVVQIGNLKCNNENQATESHFNSFKYFDEQFSKSNNILQAPRFIPKKILNKLQYNGVENVNTSSESKFSLYCPVTNTDVQNKADVISCVKFENSEKADAEIKLSEAKRNINKNTYQSIKNKFRPLVIKNKVPAKKKMNMCYCSCLTLCILPLIALILPLFVNLNIQNICNRAILFSNTSYELQQKVHGQENAILHIVKHLDRDFIHLKVLCLIGSTGIGKSYTAAIIVKNFPLKKEIFVFDALLDHSINTDMLNSLDSHYLFIIENLKLKNMDTFSNIIDILRNKKDKCITVIAIFNVEEVNNDLERRVDLIESTHTIVKALADKKIDSSIIPYQPLNEEVLDMCIEEAAMASDIRLTSDQMNEIKQSLLLSNSGCKGAYAKVQVVGRDQLSS